jgi:Protein of unknown function (DUF3572)
MPPRPAAPEAEALAIEALVFLAQDGERIARFLALTGLEAQNLREAAAQPGFLASVFEHLMQDESLLMAFAAEKHLPPEAVMRAARTLGASETPREGHWRESW